MSARRRRDGAELRDREVLVRVRSGVRVVEVVERQPSVPNPPGFPRSIAAESGSRAVCPAVAVNRVAADRVGENADRAVVEQTPAPLAEGDYVAFSGADASDLDVVRPWMKIPALDAPRSTVPVTSVPTQLCSTVMTEHRVVGVAEDIPRMPPPDDVVADERPGCLALDVDPRVGGEAGAEEASLRRYRCRRGCPGRAGSTPARRRRQPGCSRRCRFRSAGAGPPTWKSSLDWLCDPEAF